MATNACNRKRSIFCGPLEKELRLVKCFVWSVALYGAETWALRRSEETRLEAFEMWIWRRMERVKRTDRIRKEAVLERVCEERVTLKLTRKRKRNSLGGWLRNCLLKDALEGMVNGRRARGSRRYQIIDDIKIYEGYCNEIETLAHVLGSCQHGELLRNSRHHNIRKLIAQALRNKSFKVHEEVHCVASEGGGIRRADIVALDKTNSKGFILDPTVRFEMSQTQPSEVNKEKQQIYEPTIPYFREKYQMEGTRKLSIVVITEDVQNVHLLLEYIDVSLTVTRSQTPGVLRMSSEHATIRFEGIPNQAPETNKPMILNGPMRGSDQVSWAKQYISIDQETFDPSTATEPPKCYIPRSLDWQGWPVVWPPRSPDLTRLDFFLWGDVKRIVYETPIDAAEDLVVLVVEAAHVIRDNVGLLNVPHTLHSTKEYCVRIIRLEFYELEESLCYLWAKEYRLLSVDGIGDDERGRRFTIDYLRSAVRLGKTSEKAKTSNQRKRESNSRSRETPDQQANA
ncbi:hypothetical protein ANN_27363 [Periplaneta americana]|uniref:Uncharacterized protein n=1 Tax=Periplaneta americana TaxID=6978 RepID=A0ABQ8RXY8_PERAM|nr:hypothetical protein ANN_27363 [Periplaneta americana]